MFAQHDEISSIFIDLRTKTTNFLIAFDVNNVNAMLLSLVTTNTLLFVHCLAAYVTSHSVVVHVHHVTPVAGDVFQLGPADVARVPLDIRVGQNVSCDLLLGLEGLAAKLADFGPQVQMHCAYVHVQQGLSIGRVLAVRTLKSSNIV